MRENSKKHEGFTLTEILIAMSVLAFALVPLMGVMWSGVKRTDVSDAYSNASNIGASVLEFLLNDSVKFRQLNFSNPLNTDMRDSDTSKESFGIVTDTAGVNDFLGQYCIETAPVEGCEVNEGTAASCCQAANSRQRYFKIGRENYHTDLYIGAYFNQKTSTMTKATTISYSYLSNPPIDYEEVANNPQQFYDTLVLSDRNYTDSSNNNVNFEHYSPYFQPFWSLDTSSGAYMRKGDQQVSLPIYTGSEPLKAFEGLGTTLASEANHTNFAKIQLFIRWGLTYRANDSTGGSVTGEVKAASEIDSRGKTKMIQLVTFKGRFD